MQQVEGAVEVEFAQARDGRQPCAIVSLLRARAQVRLEQAIRQGSRFLRRDRIGLGLDNRPGLLVLAHQRERPELDARGRIDQSAIEPEPGMLEQDDVLSRVDAGQGEPSVRIGRCRGTAAGNKHAGAGNRAALPVLDSPAQPQERLETDGWDRGTFAVQPHPVGEVRHETGMANRYSVTRAAQHGRRRLE